MIRKLATIALVALFVSPIFISKSFAADAPATADTSMDESFGETGKAEGDPVVDRVLDTAAQIEETRNIAPSESGPQITTEVSAPGNVTLDFKNADINNVLRIISLKSGVNIVTGKEVEGPVTIRLVDVPWQKALEAVLKTYGYAYEMDGNIIRVTTVDNLKTEELSTQVYPLSYAKAEEVQGTLQEVLSDRGSIRADARTNVLIVTDVPTNLYKIEKIIARIDTITPQVLIESKIIETTLGDVDRLGIKWNLQAALTGGARPTSFPFPAGNNWLGDFDKFFPRGRPPETSTNTAGDSGAVVSTTTTSDFPVALNSDGNPVPTFPIADLNDFSFGTLDFSQLQVLLQILQTRSNAKVLSEPRITVLNNNEAKILVGEVLAVPLFERNSTTGRMEVTGYDKQDLGIQLIVTPQINSANQIDVTLHPAITSLVGFDELTPDIRVPRIATREAQTKVRVRNGETIVVGGLIREDIVDTKNKLPILGDIPLLDYFFSHKEKVVTKTDLLFFITVTIIEEPEVRIDRSSRSLS